MILVLILVLQCNTLDGSLSSVLKPIFSSIYSLVTRCCAEEERQRGSDEGEKRRRKREEQGEVGAGGRAAGGEKRQTGLGLW